MSVNRIPAQQLVEIVGLPGSGKSTLVSQLPNHRTVDASVAVVRGGLKQRIRLIIAQPAVAMICYFCITTRNGWDLGNLKRAAHVQSKLNYVSQLAGTHRVVVDEGPVHALFSALHGSSRTVVSAFFLRQMLHRITTVVGRFVYLDIPSSDIERNLAARQQPGSRFNDSTSGTEIERLIQGGAYHDILDELRRMPDVVVVSARSYADAKAAFDHLLT